MLTHIDQSQQHAMANLSQKQTQMFQLGNKHRIPTGFKNESIGVWQDAKNAVSQQMAILRQFVEEKGHSILAQSFSPSKQATDRGQTKETYSQLISRFEKDMISLRKQTKDYTKNLVKLEQDIKAYDKQIQVEKQNVKQEFKDLVEAVFNTNDILISRKGLEGGSQVDQIKPSKQMKSYNQNSRQNTQSLLMSPFDKRVNSYQKSAVNRSTSRPLTSQPKPPKLGANNFGSRKPSASNFSNSGLVTSPSRTIQIDKEFSGKTPKGNQGGPPSEWHQDLKMIKNKLSQYDEAVSRYINTGFEKYEKVQELHELLDKQVNHTLIQFLSTHDNDLIKQYFTNTILTPTETAKIIATTNLQAVQPAQKSSTSAARGAHQKSVSPYRKNMSLGNSSMISGLNRKTTPTRSAKRSGFGTSSQHNYTPTKEFKFTGDSLRHQETELRNELVRANEKSIEQQIVNRKLKEQVQILQLQIEDLRIHNNRYQMQAQTSKKKVNTARPSPHFKQSSGEGSSQQYSGGGFNPQEMQDLLTEEKDLCTKIEQFFFAMKHLQRAVNQKQDISQLKVEFETKQRSLQKMYKQIAIRTTNQLSQLQSERHGASTHSQMANKQPQSIRNRSQSTRDNQFGSTGRNTSARRQASPFHGNQAKSASQALQEKSEKNYGPVNNADKENLEKTIQQLRDQVQFKESQLQQNVQTHQKQINEIKTTMVTQINQFEEKLVEKYSGIQNRLTEKEQEIEQVKQLFVDKLRELDTNFAEIGEHLIATHAQVQKKEEDDKRKSQSSSVLNRYLTDAVDANREEEEKAMEELIQTNSSLHDQINSLKAKLKECVSQEEHQKLLEDNHVNKEKLDLLEKDKTDIQREKDKIAKEKDEAISEQSKLKQEKQLMQIEVTKANQSVQQQKLEMEKQDMIIQQSIKDIQSKLKEEIQQKMFAQKEARENDQLIADITKENEEIHNQLAEQSTDLHRLRKKYDEQKMQIKEYETEILDIQKKTSELQADLTEKKQAYEEEQERNNSLTSKINELFEDLDKIEQEERKAQQEIKTLETQVTQLQSQESQYKEEIEEQRRKSEVQTEELQKKSELIGVLEGQVEEVKAELEELQDQKKTEEELEQEREAEEEIMELKESISQLHSKEIEWEMKIAKHEEERKELQRKKEEEIEAKNQQMKDLELKVKQESEKAETLEKRLKQEVEVELEEAKNKVKSMEKEADKMKKQNWWMTALQLRVKRMVSDQLEKEREKLSQMKSQHEEEMNNQKQLYSALKEWQYEESQKQEEEVKRLADEKESLSSKLNDVESEINSKEATWQTQLDEQAQLLKENLAERTEQLEQAEKKLADASSELDDLRASGAKLTSEVKQLQQKVADFEQELQEKEAKFANEKEEQDKHIQSQKEQLEKLHKEVEDAKEESTKKNSLKEILEGQMKTKVEEFETMIKQKEEAESKLKEATDQVGSLEKSKKETEEALASKSEENERELSDLKQQLETETDKAKQAEDKLHELTGEFETSKQSLEEAQTKLAAVQKQIEELQSENQQAIKKYEEVASQLATAESDKATIQESSEAKEKELNEKAARLEQSLEDSQAECQQVKEKLSSAEQDLEKLQEQMKETQTEAAELKDENKKVHDKLRMALEIIPDKKVTDQDSATLVDDMKDACESLQNQVKEEKQASEQLRQDIDKKEESLKTATEEKEEAVKAKAAQKEEYDQLIQKMASQEVVHAALEEEKQDLQQQIDDLEKEVKVFEEKKENRRSSLGGHHSRNSIGSDGDEFSSVQDMKDHLKHTRQILIQFISKIPFSKPDNEATLPVIYSMFEFTKDEQEALHQAREKYNKENFKKEDKKKGLTNFFKKKDSKTSPRDESFNSGGLNTANSEK